MPKGANQKDKLYHLDQIMLEQTDEEHYLTMPPIMQALGEYGVTADRKSIYNDLRDLDKLGIEVEGEAVIIEQTMKCTKQSHRIAKSG